MVIFISTKYITHQRREVGKPLRQLITSTYNSVQHTDEDWEKPISVHIYGI